MIGECPRVKLMQGFENFKYTALPAEYKAQKVSLVDFNQEAK